MNQLFNIALSQTEGIGSIMFRQLINIFGDAEKVFDASPAKLLKIPNFGNSTLNNLKKNKEQFEKAEWIIKNSEKHHIKIVSYKDDLYPKRMLGFFDAPPILFMRGNGNLDYVKTLGIVGTRDATEYGRNVTEQIVQELASSNVQIISGLAYGIDIAAHKSALKNNLSTVAVLGASIEKIYPAIHKKTASEIENSGMLISENPVGSTILPSFFIARNRIIAAISDAILIVESAKKGGSMVTAEFANNYNKEVFAIPGSLNLKYSEGPNYLIANNKAQIFTNTEEFLLWMKWTGEEKEIVKKSIDIDLSTFTQDESKVLSLLMHNKDMLIDEISWQSEIHLNKLASILLNLEFQDLVKQNPGKKFSLK